MPDLGVLSAVASRLPATPRRATPPRRSTAGTPLPASNSLHGHAFLSQDEYAEESRRATQQGIEALIQSPAYGAWMARNHNRLTLAPGETDDDDEGDDSEPE